MKSIWGELALVVLVALCIMFIALAVRYHNSGGAEAESAAVSEAAQIAERHNENSSDGVAQRLDKIASAYHAINS